MALGVACGFGFLIGKSSWLPVVALLGVVFLWIGWSRPMMLVVLMGSLILLESKGVIATIIIPWTLAKVVTAGSLGVWGLRRLVLREPILQVGSELYVMGFLLLAMCTSLVFTLDLKTSILGVSSMLLVLVLCYFVFAMAREFDVEMVLLLLIPAGLAYMIYGVGFSTVGFSEVQGGRLEGSDGNPNDWALSLNFLCLPLLGFLAGKQKRWAWGLFAVMALMLLSNHALAASRGALIALVLAAPLVLLPFRKQPILLLVGLPVLAVVGSFMMDFSLVIGRFAEASVQADYSTLAREETVWVGLQVFKENWLFGTGIGTFRYSFADTSHSGIVRTAHNMYISLMAETGVIGVGAIVTWFGLLFQTAIVGVRRTWNTEHEGMALGFLALLLSWWISGIFADLLFDTMVYFYIGLLFAASRSLDAVTDRAAAA